jgi:tRNA threonylcarbamoyl adenosine modification protein YeaZ
MTSQSPKLLVVDTSGPQAVVEAWAGVVRLACEQFGAARHVQGLSAQLKSLLAQVDWRLADIDAIAANIGPGSFTGVRVGLAMVKALVYVDGEKLIGVDNFDAWASGVPRDAASAIDIVIGAQLNSVHIVRFEQENNQWSRRQLRTVARDQLATILDPDIPVSGPSANLVRSLTPNANWIDVEPNVAAVALSRFVAGQFDDPWTIEPFYVLPSSAEEKWDARPPVT